ncbi:AI-2E family transporter [bacterium]|nr:AI-2E family transporter [bacterium]
MTSDPYPSSSNDDTPVSTKSVTSVVEQAKDSILALPQRLAERPRLVIPFLILVAVTLAVGWVFLTLVQPFLLTLLAAATVALVAVPLQDRLRDRLHGREYLAAGLITVVFALLLIAPVLLGVVFGFQELEKGITFVQGWLRDHSSDIRDRLAILDERFQISEQDLRARVEEMGKSMLGLAIRWGQGLFARIVETGLHLAIGLFAFFFFLADGKRIIESWEETTPLDVEHDRVIRREFSTVCRGAIWGTILAAIFQGIAMTIGLGIIELFTHAGLGRWLFLLGGLTTVAGLIPLAGASFVWLPTAIVLYFNDHIVAAILVVAFGFIAVSSIDNVVKILVIKDSGNLHPLLVLVCVFGGLQAIGVLGLFVGPAIGAIVFSLLKVVRTELAKITGRDPVQPQPSTTG